MVRRRIVRLAAVASCALLVSACGAARDVGGSAQDVASEVATPMPMAEPTSPPAPALDEPSDGVDVSADDRPAQRSLRPIIDEAVRDLARREHVSEDQIDVVLAQRVTWPDATLGCPRGGSGEIGGPRQGVRVHLRIDDLLYRYHTGTREEQPFLCDPQAAKSEEYNDRIEP